MLKQWKNTFSSQYFRIIQNFMKISGGTILSQALGFFFAIYCSTQFSKEFLGPFLLWQVLLIMMFQFSELGLTNALAVHLHSLEEHESYWLFKKILKRRLIYSPIWIVTGTVGLYFFGFREENSILKVVLLNAIFVVGYILFSQIQIFENARGHFGLVAIQNFIVQILRLGALFIFKGMPNLSIYHLVVMYCLPFLVLAAGFYFFMGRAVAIRSESAGLNVAKVDVYRKIDTIAKWDLIGSFAVIVGTRIDSLLVSSLVSLNEMVTYNVALSWAGWGPVANSALVMVFLNRFSKSSIETCLDSAKGLLIKLVLVGIAIWVCSLVTAYFLFGHIYEGKYQGLYLCYVIITLGYSFGFWLSPVSAFFYKTAKSDFIARLNYLQVVVSAVVGFVAVKHFQIVGAAASLLISKAIGAAILAAYFMRKEY